MSEDTQRQLDILKGRIDALEAKVVRQRSWGEYVAILSRLPGIRVAYGFGSVGSGGEVYDSSNKGLTLTMAGNPKLKTHNYIVPYFDYDGTGDLHSRTDEVHLRVAGNESYIAVPGLYAGGWFWIDNLTGTRAFFSKHDGATSAGSSWIIDQIAGALKFSVYSGAFNFSTPAKTITTGNWIWACGQYIPSGSVSLYVNADTPLVNTTSIPATINVNATPLNVAAANSSAFHLDGRATGCFMGAGVLDPEIIRYLYRYGKALLL